MSKWNRRIVYIDGFAGPGRYRTGEDGSPIVVLKAARDHSFKIDTELVCLFVEKDRERSMHLEATIKEISPPLPSHVKWEVAQGTFDEHLTKIFAIVDAQNKSVAPMLVFADPFGFSQTPFATIRHIMKNNKSEVLINVMFEFANRFLSDESLASNYDGLFGTNEWRAVAQSTDPAVRRNGIHDIYLRQLETAAKYVHSFAMLNKNNNTEYFLFFATNNLLGLEKMKDAMWKVDNTGSFQFSDYEHAKRQMSLFGEHPNLAPLREAIMRTFKGREISIEVLGDWVITNTPFLRTHLKGPVLAPMESDGELTVIRGKPTRRSGTFSEGTVIKFP